MIRDAIRQAEEIARTSIEQTYDGLCTIIEHHEVTDKITKLSGDEDVTVTENQPCKLSFEKLSAAVQTPTAAAVSQGIKLFMAPEIKVSSGSKIIVTQNGVTDVYSASGKPAVYYTHQEIMLELFREWA